MAQGSEVEIKTGLKDGDIVVNYPAPNLESGSHVDPINFSRISAGQIAYAERGPAGELSLLGVLN